MIREMDGIGDGLRKSGALGVIAAEAEPDEGLEEAMVVGNVVAGGGAGKS